MRRVVIKLVYEDTENSENTFSLTRTYTPLELARSILPFHEKVTPLLKKFWEDMVLMGVFDR